MATIATARWVVGRTTNGGADRVMPGVLADIALRRAGFRGAWL
jgi:hypothetical protein